MVEENGAIYLRYSRKKIITKDFISIKTDFQIQGAQTVNI